MTNSFSPKQEAKPTDAELKIRRPAIRPLDEWVDQFMLSLGIGIIDMAKPEVRVNLRALVRSFMRNCLRMTLSDLQRGADRGMRQSLDFMFDPEHAKTTKKRRKEKAEQRTERQAAEQQARAIKERERLGRLQ